MASEFGDVILGFNTDALPGYGSIIGGDTLDLADLFAVGTVFDDAVDGGYLIFGGDATATTLSVDLDGAVGAGAAQLACTFDGIGFVDSATSEALFADNIVVSI